MSFITMSFITHIAKASSAAPAASTPPTKSPLAEPLQDLGCPVTTAMASRVNALAVISRARGGERANPAAGAAGFLFRFIGGGNGPRLHYAVFVSGFQMLILRVSGIRNRLSTMHTAGTAIG
jgi:hypothetical protein